MEDPSLTGRFRGSSSLHGDAPSAPSNTVRHVRVDITREPLGFALRVVDGEGDRLVGDIGDVPLAVRPVVCAAVQGVLAIVLLQLVGLAVEGELGVSNAVGVTAGYSVVDGMSRVRGYGVSADEDLSL